MTNKFVAIGNQTTFGGLMQGVVTLISPDVVSVSVGNQVFYSQSDGKACIYSGAEYVIVPADRIMGKL
jgi:co-chaperonin GroES (HSP10)